MPTIARGQVTLVSIAYGMDKDMVRSRWVEINGTESLTEVGTSGSYPSFIALSKKYAAIAGNVVLTYNSQVLTYNGFALTYPSVGTVDVEIAYNVLRDFLIEAGLNDGKEEFTDGFDWDTYNVLLSNYNDAEKRVQDKIYFALQCYSDAGDASTFSSLQSFENTINQTIEEIQSVLDNTIETWFYDGAPTLSNAPASSWSVSEYDDHLGDLYYDNLTGTGYRFQNDNGTYKWVELSDTQAAQALAIANLAKDTADHKRRVYLTQPGINDVYDAGDLWLNATVNGIYPSGNASNEMLVARTAKAAGVSFSASDWMLATKYTDDTYAGQVATSLSTFINQTFETYKSGVKTQLDKKIETYFSSTNPASNWTAQEKIDHEGDLWHNTSNQTRTGTGWSVEPGQTAVWDKTKWVLSSVPSEVFDRIDGKAAIYTGWEDWIVSGENKLNLLDVFIPESTVTPVSGGTTYYADKFYRCIQLTPSIAFEELAYTDDAAVTQLRNDTAYLTSAFGDGSTTQTGGLVLSQFIGVKNNNNLVVAALNGSRSLVGWQDATHGALMFAAGISSLGDSETPAAASTKIFADGTIVTNKLVATEASISGSITATSLTLGSGVTIDYSEIDNAPDLSVYAETEDLNEVAFTGDFFDLNHVPVIPTDITQLSGGTNVMHTSDVTISSQTTANGLTKRTITINGSQFTEIEAGDFVLTQIGIGHANPTSGQKYFKVDSDGLLTAKNAIIYGTIYASAGEIGGWSLTNGLLHSGSSNNYVAIDTQSGAGHNYTIWAGSETAASAPFSVERNGEITASRGTIGGFHITEDSIYSGKDSIDDESEGVYIGEDGIALGESSFSVSSEGYLYSTSGNIGGFSISGSLLTCGSNNTYLALSSQVAATYSFWIGNPSPSSAPFSVSRLGALKSTSGTIGGFSIDTTRLCSGSNTNYVALDSGTANVDYAFWAGATVPGSAKFSVKRDGSISATKGKIGNFTLDETSIWNGKPAIDEFDAGIYIGDDGIAIGENNKFVVDADSGELYASGAHISGSITATSGYIGGFEIGSKRLSSGSGNNYVALDSGTTNVDYAIWAGNSAPASANFSVKRSGEIKSTSGVLAGWTISSSDLRSSDDSIILDATNNRVCVGDNIKIGDSSIRVTYGSGSNEKDRVIIKNLSIGPVSEYEHKADVATSASRSISVASKSFSASTSAATLFSSGATIVDLNLGYFEPNDTIRLTQATVSFTVPYGAVSGSSSAPSLTLSSVRATYCLLRSDNTVFASYDTSQSSATNSGSSVTISSTQQTASYTVSTSGFYRLRIKTGNEWIIRYNGATSYSNLSSRSFNISNTLEFSIHRNNVRKTIIASDGLRTVTNNGYFNISDDLFQACVGNYAIKIDSTGIYTCTNATAGTPTWVRLTQN